MREARISFKPCISASTVCAVFSVSRIVAGQIELHVAPAAVFGEVQLPIRHLRQQGHHALLPLLLADIALERGTRLINRVGIANLAVVVAHEFDHVGDFGRFPDDRGRGRRDSRRILERPARGQFDVQFSAGKILGRHECLG
jgi:hypothetical protein